MPLCSLFEDIEEEQLRETADWDEATRRAEDGQAPQDEELRALCSCGRPLHRYARLPRYQAFLMCSSDKECTRCDNTILAGEMHFVCAACSDVHVCKECGPGVFIQRQYDFLDAGAGEVHVQDIPSRVMHNRRKKRSLMDLQAPSQQIAAKVLQRVHQLTMEVAKEDEDVLHRDWRKDGLLYDLLGVQTQEEAAESMFQLVAGVQDVFAAQPSLTEVKVPCKIFGDIHGQLRDLLLLFHSFGMPGSPDCPQCVFNGDFVDRGKHQVEVLVVLFALKAAYPMQVSLNRGNHEDTTMNHKYGFEKAVLAAFPQVGPTMYSAISTCFMYLPYACLVGGKVLALHGGIGDGKWRLDDLRSVKRPLNHEQLQEPQNRMLWNIMWSDPIEDDSGSNVFGVHNSPRSKMAVKFGWNVTQDFCVRNGLDLVVRSHQSKKGGLGFDVMHNESLVRVFSARDYEGNSNDGAVLQVSKEEGSDCLSVRSQVLRSIDASAEDSEG